MDTLLRSINVNQTMGIPIGPDCSLLIAEIILGAIDKELARKIKKIRGIRFIDDYEFAAIQRSDAETIASQLQSILSKFDLALNPSKTRIIELPEPLESLWTSQLRTILFRSGGVMTQRNDLTAYFDIVFNHAKREPDEGILKYAIARLNGIEIENDNWPILEAILCHCALVEPACLSQVCEQIAYYKSKSLPQNNGLWADCLNQIVIERLPLGHASEAAWAMWLMMLLHVQLDAKAAKVVDDCDDSPSALMGLGLASMNLAPGCSFPRLNSFAEPDELFGPQWLLCYEGNYQNWLKTPSGLATLASNPQFDFLNRSGVYFFDIKAQQPTPRRTIGNPRVSGGGGDYPI